MKLDFKLLIASAIAGLAGFLSVQALYALWQGTIVKPVLIAILAAVFVLICCTAICLTVMLTMNTKDEFLFLYGRGAIIVGLVCCMIPLFLCTMLFEWIYDSQEAKAAGASSYIFLLDESGSMETNDPDLQRYNAVESVVRTLPEDVPYAVYMFSDDCVRIRDMAPASAEMAQRPADADHTMGGKTNIKNALTLVYNDLDSGYTEGGSRPQLLLLTDGYASDMGGLFGKRILKSYQKAGIAVSTIGLGQVDEDLLSEIAAETKGQYVRVSDAHQLTQGFVTAAYQTGERDLISRRSVLEMDWLYLLLRIFFLTLIGIMVAIMKAMSCGGDSSALIVIEGAIAALAAAIVMEAGLSAGMPVFLCRFVYWMALAITPQLVKSGNGGYSGSRSVRTGKETAHKTDSYRIEW